MTSRGTVYGRVGPVSRVPGRQGVRLRNHRARGPSPVGQVSKMAATARHQDSGGGGGKRQGAGQDAGSRRRHRLLGQYAAERSSPCVVSARTGLPVSPTLSSVPSPDAGIARRPDATRGPVTVANEWFAPDRSDLISRSCSPRCQVRLVALLMRAVGSTPLRGPPDCHLSVRD